ncbi:MAG TPA: caspase family protein [Polyangiaceae bacterium]|nr:caspase family protein [Polyangiaceae bacterium]
MGLGVVAGGPLGCHHGRVNTVLEDLGLREKRPKGEANASQGGGQSPRASAAPPSSSASQGVVVGETMTQPALPEPAAVGATRPEAFALVVGIERYRDVPPAKGARNDALEFARVASSTLGVPRGQIHTLIDDRATKEDIEAELDWVKTSVPKNGRVYFYFSGHGVPDAQTKGSYLVPYNFTPSRLGRTGVALSSALVTLSHSRAKELYAFVDACFAGNQAGLMADDRPVVQVVEDVVAPANVILLTATSQNQLSGPDVSGKHGAFTKYLIEGIGQGLADSQGDHQISAQELFDWMKGKVETEAHNADGRLQQPKLTSSKGMDANDAIVAYISPSP